MFFELSKILNFFLTPITWSILLLAGGFIWKSRRGRRICMAGALIVFVVFTNRPLVNYVRSCEARKYEKACLSEGKFYRAAIVMGGFGSINRRTGQLRYEDERADRLWEAVRLYKLGKVERILITGDDSSRSNDMGMGTTALFLAYMEQMGMSKEAFILEQKARNTRENAVFTAGMLKEYGIRDADCLLITSATHMKRSLGCFAKAGWRPDFFAVGIYDPLTEINHRSFYPSWEAAVKWQEIFNEWLGDLVYKVKGYI